jgi:TolB-like protein
MAEERAQRRLAAILAVDVVGYSRLMEADDAGTLAVLKARRRDILEPLVARYQGRIFKVTGDGVLVEFASAVNAVQCAVDIQQGMARANGDQTDDVRIVLRVGVNLGDVIVEGKDLYGDGVNIATRLEAMADPGGIVVSGTAYDHIKSKVKVGFDDLGAQSLKNITEPVRAYRVAGMPMVAVESSKVITEKPSIAVLPFTNMSGDPAQDYFSDGVTEDVITELSRFRNLFVIARNSSFAYRDKGLTIQQIAHALGVQHILEGSIRITANRVRVVAQLIDAASGHHLWAERYDRDLSDIFAVQDEVTRSIVAILAVRLEEEGAARAQRKPPENMRAYDYWLRGKKCMEWFTLERNSEARRHFEQAIALDPRYARGYAGLALVDRWSVWYTRSYTPEHHADETARRYALKAVELDDADHIPHVILAWAHIWQRDFEEARHELGRALAVNPNDADLLAESCGAWKYLGEPEAAIAAGNLALRLNPLHPPWYLGYLASAYLMARRHDEAIAVGARAPDAWPETCGMLTAACAHTNRLEEARNYATRWVGVIRSRFADAHEVTPRDCAQWILHFNLFKRQSDFDHLAEGLRKAGLVE